MDLAEVVFKLVLVFVLLSSLAIGGLDGFAKVFSSVLTLVATLFFAAAVLVVFWFVGKAVYRLWWLPRSRARKRGNVSTLDKSAAQRRPD